MIRAIAATGEDYKNGIITIPELLSSSKAMTQAIGILKPHFKSDSEKSRRKVIIGTVEGDLHDIGKNMIAALLEAEGFEIIDLGVDVPIRMFLTAYEANPDTQIIACSVMLTTTLPLLKKTVSTINDAQWRQQVKVMVGGAAVTQEFAKEIGADAYTPDVFSAVKKAMEFLDNI